MKIALMSLFLLAAAASAFAEDVRCTGKGCLDWPLPSNNTSLFFEYEKEEARSCKGQGDRCSSTEECCEGNECLRGDQPYPTCGGG